MFEEEMRKMIKEEECLKIYMALCGIISCIALVGIFYSSEPVFFLAILLLLLSLMLMTDRSIEHLKMCVILIGLNDINEIFLKELSIKELHTRIVKLDEIKIPKYFLAPDKIKLNEREEFFKANNKFKVDIIVDKNNKLKDGYTTYLIAKKMGFTYVAVEEK